MDNLQVTKQPDEYNLTEDEKGMVEPLVEMNKQVQLETTTLLNAIVRLRKLEGNWTLQGDRLIRVHANGNGAQ